MGDFRLIKIKLTHMIQKETEGRFIRKIIFINLKIQIIKEDILVLGRTKRLIKNIKRTITSIREEIDTEKDGMIGQTLKRRKIITVI
jgi:hypothetical protein